MNEKKDIRSLTLEEITEFCTENTLPKFRAKQIWEWLWKKRIDNFEEITSLSKEVRKLKGINKGFSYPQISEVYLCVQY